MKHLGGDYLTISLWMSHDRSRAGKNENNNNNNKEEKGNDLAFHLRSFFSGGFFWGSRFSHPKPRRCNRWKNPPQDAERIQSPALKALVKVKWGAYKCPDNKRVTGVVIHSLKLTMVRRLPSRYLPNRKVVFQPPFFRGYVKLRGGSLSFFGFRPICRASC